MIPVQMPTLPVPRYEEEEEEDDEDDDAYAPELPPELVAARANPSGAPSSSSSTPQPPQPQRRTMGPARGPFRREEEEEESSEEEEIGPAPPPGAGPSSDAHEDAVKEFMQKEAQRRQAVEVRLMPTPSIGSFFSACMHPCACVSRTHLCLCSTGGCATKDTSARGVDARPAFIFGLAEQCATLSHL
jgi:hypothetical protein